MALVVIAAAVFCLTCCLWMLMSGKFRPAKAPPHVSEGPPIVGNLMGFALGPRGPLDFIKRNFEVHGGAYSMRVAHKTQEPPRIQYIQYIQYRTRQVMTKTSGFCV